MKLSKKLLLFTAVMILVICMPFPAFATDIDYTLTTGVPVNPEAPANETKYYYLEFTPDETGTYYIESSDVAYSVDLACYYYGADSSFDEYEDYYYGCDGEDFYLSFYVNKGYTYYFKIRCEERDSVSSDFNITVYRHCEHNNTEYADAVSPTCSEDGRTAGTVCTDCGRYIDGCKPISAMCTDDDSNLVCDFCSSPIELITTGECDDLCATQYEYYSDGLLRIKGSGIFNKEYLYDEKIDINAIRKVIIEPGITEIPYEAFAYCTALSEISIPETVFYIGAEAFYNCYSLSSVTIPDAVKNIFYGTFENCKGLTTVNIPEGIVSIDSSAFDGCTGITRFTVDKDNEYFLADEQGVIYDSYYENLRFYPSASPETTYTIPESVKYVYNDDCFREAKNLKKLIVENYNIYVTVGDSVNEIVCYPYSEIYDSYEGRHDVEVSLINDAAFSGIEIEKMPFKTTYIGGQEYFQSEGMKLNAVMSDGTRVELDSNRVDINYGIYEVIPKGLTEITLTFKNKSVSVPITTVSMDEFTVECDTVKELYGASNYIYFIPEKTDEYLLMVDSTAGGHFNIARHSYTDIYGYENYREEEYLYFAKDNIIKSGTVKLYAGVKYRIQIGFVGDRVDDLGDGKYNFLITCGCKHQYTEVNVMQNATCTEEGYTAGVLCLACDKWLSGHKLIEATGHEDADENGICDICAEKTEEEDTTEGTVTEPTTETPLVPTEPAESTTSKTEEPTESTTKAEESTTKPTTTKKEETTTKAPTTTDPVTTKTPVTATAPATTAPATEATEKEQPAVKVKKPAKAKIRKPESVKDKQIVVKWNSVKDADGYQLAYSTGKKFTKKTTKTKLIKKAKTTKTTLKKLKSGKKYFIRIRAYKTVSGKKIYGAYSKVMTVKVK